eukprot:1700216-Amphidinium_carterae.1
MASSHLLEYEVLSENKRLGLENVFDGLGIKIDPFSVTFATTHQTESVFMPTYGTLVASARAQNSDQTKLLVL